tara:strand:- start:148 stop:1059 length:912 start_codon:yes stop_codon:yes gene_type:complete
MERTIQNEETTEETTEETIEKTSEETTETSEETSEEMSLSNQTDEIEIIEEPQIECRICFESFETLENRFIYPCYCSGSSKYVHYKCLERWRTENRENDAFFRCRECHARYNIKYKNKIETFRFSQEILFIIRKCINFFYLNMCFVFLGNTSRILDKYTGYVFLQNVYFIKPNKNFLQLIKEDTIYGISFYYAYMINCVAMIFYIFFFYVISQKVYNQCLYWKKMWRPIFSSFILSSHFFYLFYILNLDKHSGAETFLNLETLFSVLTLYLLGALLIIHNTLIDKINLENPSLILNHISEYSV